jgi:hypothetical protein
MSPLSIALKDRLAALLEQEVNDTYGCSTIDYFQHTVSLPLHYCDQVNGTQEWCGRCYGVFNEMTRERICEWLYHVIDHFNYDREIVAITLNYFDRYLSNKDADECLRNFNTNLVPQCVAIAALNIVLKVNFSRVDHLPLLLEFSQKLFSPREINNMESSILSRLSWKLSPPTSLAFLVGFIPFMAKGSPCANLKHHDVSEIAQFLVELSVCDYYFVRKKLKPSSIALASLLNAIDIVFPASPADCKMVTNILLSNLRTHLGIIFCEQTKQCKERLEQIYRATG